MRRPVEGHAAAHRIELEGGAWYVHRTDWLPATEASTLQQRLVTEIPWEQRSIVLFGRERMQPRLVSWFGSVPYRYSGRTLEARPPPALVAALLETVSQELSAPFNHILLNRYRNGEDSMGWHSDDEAELGQNPTVASLSLGTSRVLMLRKKRPRRALTHRLELNHGSLLVMGGTCQHLYRHQIPKQQGVSTERISLTFRNVQRRRLSGLK